MFKRLAAFSLVLLVTLSPQKVDAAAVQGESIAPVGIKSIFKDEYIGDYEDFGGYKFTTSKKTPGTMVFEIKKGPEFDMGRWEQMRTLSSEYLGVMLYKQSFGAEGRNQYADRYLDTGWDFVNRESKDDFYVRFYAYIDEPTTDHSYYLGGTYSLYRNAYKHKVTFYKNKDLSQLSRKDRDAFLNASPPVVIPPIEKPNLTDINPNIPVLPKKVNQEAVARVVFNGERPLYQKNEDGSLSVFKTLKKGESLRVHGIEGDYYNCGGYYVKYEKGITNAYIGRGIAKKNGVIMYSPEGSQFSIIDKNETLRVYNVLQDKLDVGGSYYLKKDASVEYFIGYMNIKKDAKMYSLKGTTSKAAKGKHRVVRLEQGKYFLQNGSYLVKDNNASYVKN
ncbi:hypothetical protein IHV12_19670 [Fictibacillus sp. 7GRE50]|uniref:hypothetical protein n=1 Tax=Fictibacillus sp. 7GRE50 TaxID=2745878 RepID=UPI0018CD1A55|nr:hypothetical protein [Fictibacillus sp. 7GRE50]MBH0167147.1 hypothetical protein [Fictibacillus sp. 7GRE50]